MANLRLTKKGKLRSKYQPAVYFDSSMLIDYFLAAGLENPYEEIDRINDLKGGPDSYIPIFRTVIGSDKELAQICDIRRKLILWPETVKTYPVVTPLCILELQEFSAEQVFRQLASEAGAARLMQHKSKKDIGDYIRKLIQRRREEIGQRRKYHRSHTKTPMAKLMNLLADIQNFEEGMKGLHIVDIVNFGISLEDAFSTPSYYTWLQLGATDVLHILLAEHLGCQYLASRDSDFSRVKDRIEEETGIVVLTNFDQLIDVL